MHAIKGEKIKMLHSQVFNIHNVCESLLMAYSDIY